ncbi:hypothetical protein [Flavobacterium difficile]|uniref:Uncharacterized protein n=1 Tax=Flavobacterium difficile TaxID=2709659 RepID=A0ABX0I549_9FLAO|nr:hypothetical protein [Flavobacterium difficile]NHM01243.1 hypothetical protein [Flavobacterium difficile]
MNSEENIYNKIKNASQKGEKDFPGMDKVWNRVEEKLDNTITVQKKNNWQKLAIAAIVLFSFSIIYQLVTNEETYKGEINRKEENSVIVSKDSIEKIIDQANEVVVENGSSKKTDKAMQPFYNFNLKTVESDTYLDASEPSNFKINDSIEKYSLQTEKLVEENRTPIDLQNNLFKENEISMRNSTTNFVSSNATNGFFAPNKKYDTTITTSKYKSKSEKAPVIENKDLVVIDGVAMGGNFDAKSELAKLKSNEIDDVTYLPNPLYIINGIEYSEESLFGKNPTSPYAPLSKQEITSFNSIKPIDAIKIYGKKGEKGVVIITTKNGKPANK